MPIHPTSTSSAIKSGEKQSFAAPASFQHITLNTGHACAQLREAVETNVAVQLSQLITRALVNDGWTDLKSYGIDSAVQISVCGSTLLADLYLPCKAPRTVKPAIRIGVCVESSGGDEIWQQLLSCAPVIAPSVPLTPAGQPWIGVVVKDAEELVDLSAMQLIAYAQMMQWAGDFERCLAWGFVTWLESRA